MFEFQVDTVLTRRHRSAQAPWALFDTLAQTPKKSCETPTPLAADKYRPTKRPPIKLASFRDLPWETSEPTGVPCVRDGNKEISLRILFKNGM